MHTAVKCDNLKVSVLILSHVTPQAKYFLTYLSPLHYYEKMLETWIKTTAWTWSPNYSKAPIYVGTIYMFPPRNFLVYNFY